MRKHFHLLQWAAGLYGIGLLAHTADHLRRGTDVLTTGVLAAGYLSTALGMVTMGLVFARHRSAPSMAIATGFPIALGVAAVHLLPRWSVFSDAFPGSTGTGVTGLSWLVVLIEIAGALALGVAGVLELRRSPDAGSLVPIGR